MDSLRYPAREVIDLNSYSRKCEPWFKTYPVDTVIASRGCSFSCKFCSAKEFWKRKYRIRSPEGVVEEIKYLMKKFKTQAIYFREDLFLSNFEFIKRFCSLVKELKIEWMCEGRVDSFDEPKLKMMKKSGLRAVNLGIEVWSDKGLEFINKGFKVEKIESIIKVCKKLNIFVGGGVIIGLPYETRLDYIGYNRFVGIPTSELYEFIQGKNLVKYNYNGILIPGTFHLSADEGTLLYYNIAHPLPTRLLSLLPKGKCFS